jgi:hypothetical protein
MIARVGEERDVKRGERGEDESGDGIDWNAD